MTPWLSEYIETRKSFFNSEKYKETIQTLTSENEGNSYIYKLIQPTGLIYGCPVQLPFGEPFNNQFLSENREFSLILLEGFIHCSVAHNYKNQIKTEIEINNILKQIEDYYLVIAPALSAECKDISNYDTNKFEYISALLSKNIEIDDLFVENNFTRYFFNSLLFLDLIFFDKFLNIGAENHFVTFEKTLSTLLKVFIAASHSNEDKLSRGEKVLYESLIRACKLSENTEIETIKFIKNKIIFEEIDFTSFDSFCLKKLCFEIAFLMTMTDKIVTETEQLFLEKLTFKLNLSAQEKRNSIESVQSFIYKTWDNQVLYQENINYQNLHKGLIKKITSQISRNKTKLMKEIYESKELVELLSKSAKQELTKEEKTKVKTQLTDILKSIPSLAIFMLPGGALLLPLIMKILPSQMLLPSSFQEKK